MKALSAFFVFATLFATPVFAKEQCVEVDYDSPRMTEARKEGYFTIELVRKEVRQAELIGVGLGYNTSNEVVLVFLDSPAEQAGVPIGGVIVAVNGISTETLSHEEVGEAIRGAGKVGTLVALSIARDDGSVGLYVLQRAKVKGQQEVLIARLCKIKASPKNK